MRFILYFFPLFVFSQNFELNKLFERAVINNLSCDSLVNFCSKEENLKKKAYLGAGLVLKAKHNNSPFSKLSFFKKGKRILNDAINKNSNFVEFRWLRYCLQKNAPKFLNYNNNIFEDSLFIKENGTIQQQQSLLKKNN